MAGVTEVLVYTWEDIFVREVKPSFIWKTNEQLVAQFGPCLVRFPYSSCILVPRHHHHNQHS